MGAKKGENQKLKPIQIRFVEELIRCGNKSEAARRAGYSKKNAATRGYDTFKLPQVQEYWKIRSEQELEDLRIDQKSVLRQLCKIAFADIKDYVEYETVYVKIGETDNGEPIYEYRPIVNCKPSEEVDGSLISEVSISPKGVFSFKLHDKGPAIDKMMKHLKMFVDNDKKTPDVNIFNLAGLTTEELKRLAKLDSETTEGG